MVTMNEEIEMHEKLGVNYFLNDFGKKYKVERTRKGCYWDLEATALTDTGKTYLIEIKAYVDLEHPRPYTKYNGYQIDWEKIKHVMEQAYKQNRIPILYVAFSDCHIVWDLSKIGLEELKKRVKRKKVNKQGLNYGKYFEYTEQTYLYKSEATWVH